MTRITGTLHEDLCAFRKVSSWVYRRIIHVLDKICRENQQTHSVCNSIFFFENRTVCEIMWKNLVGPDRPLTTLWRISWVTKATYIQSEDVILTGFTRQEWLRKRVSIVCLYVHWLLFCWPVSLRVVVNYCRWTQGVVFFTTHALSASGIIRLLKGNADRVMKKFWPLHYIANFKCWIDGQICVYK